MNKRIISLNDIIPIMGKSLGVIPKVNKRGRPKLGSKKPIHDKNDPEEYHPLPAAVAGARTIYKLENTLNPCQKLESVAYYLNDENNFSLAKFAVGHRFCQESSSAEEENKTWFQTTPDFTGRWEDLPKVIETLTSLYRSAPFTAPPSTNI